jgi:hypothetical protein
MNYVPEEGNKTIRSEANISFHTVNINRKIKPYEAAMLVLIIGIKKYNGKIK